MPKQLRCADLMPGCSFVAEGKDVDEVMKKAVEHAKRDHKMQTIPPDVAAKAKAAIRDVPASGALRDAQGEPFKLGDSKLG